MRGFIAELDARLDERMGAAKVAQLRELLEELSGAVASR